MKIRDIAALAALLLLVLAFPKLSHATGGKVVTSGGSVTSSSSTSGAVATGGSVGDVSAFGGPGGAVNATIAGSGGANVTTKTYSLGAPGYSGASQCPVGVIPIIGGTTGAEFCRALWTAMVTGDRGPICKSALFSSDMDEFCADYWEKHGKP